MPIVENNLARFNARQASFESTMVMPTIGGKIKSALFPSQLSAINKAGTARRTGNLGTSDHNSRAVAGGRHSRLRTFRVPICCDRARMMTMENAPPDSGVKIQRVRRDSFDVAFVLARELNHPK